MHGLWLGTVLWLECLDDQTQTNTRDNRGTKQYFVNNKVCMVWSMGKDDRETGRRKEGGFRMLKDGFSVTVCRAFP